MGCYVTTNHGTCHCMLHINALHAGYIFKHNELFKYVRTYVTQSAKTRHNVAIHFSSINNIKVTVKNVFTYSIFNKALSAVVPP